MFKFDLHKTDRDSKARRGSFHTPHGTIETPIWDKADDTFARMRGAADPRELELYGEAVDRMERSLPFLTRALVKAT